MDAGDARRRAGGIGAPVADRRRRQTRRLAVARASTRSSARRRAGTEALRSDAVRGRRRAREVTLRRARARPGPARGCRRRPTRTARFAPSDASARVRGGVLRIVLRDPQLVLQRPERAERTRDAERRVALPRRLLLRGESRERRDDRSARALVPRTLAQRLERVKRSVRDFGRLLAVRREPRRREPRHRQHAVRHRRQALAVRLGGARGGERLRGADADARVRRVRETRRELADAHAAYPRANTRHASCFANSTSMAS